MGRCEAEDIYSESLRSEIVTINSSVPKSLIHDTVFGSMYDTITDNIVVSECSLRECNRSSTSVELNMSKQQVLDISRTKYVKATGPQHQ